MEEDGTNGVLIGPIIEIFSNSFVLISDTVNAAKSVHVHKEDFKEQSHFLELIANILRKLSNMNVNKFHEKLRGAAEILTGKIMVARQLALKCSNRNKIYLMLSCHRIVKDLESSTREIGRALSGISLSCFEGTVSGIQDEIIDLCKIMLAVEYQVTRAEEEVLKKINLAIQVGKVDPSSASVLLKSIVEIVQTSTNQPSVLMKELEEFKNEIENAELRDDITEALWMDQIIVLLSQDDIPSSPHQRAEKYLKKRNSLGRKLLEPLQSFYCPISGDIMEDPVETPAGQSYERAAIVKWLKDGNSFCPLTKTPLNTMVLRSNRNLRGLIEEWKDRNTMITIASMKQRIQSTVVEEVIECLGQLKDICLERELHQEWLIMEDYLPVLIGLLGARTQQVRKDALAILCILAKDHDGHKEKIAGIDNAIEFIVHELGRRIDESKFALQLLLELSTHDQARSSMGKAQGCILLLVTTMCSSNDEQATRNAKQLLHNLSFIDQNVVEMAKANYFGPLLHLLSSGSEETRVKMAKTLAELELADHKKILLCNDGAHRPLLELLAVDNLDIKTIAIKALQNLASSPQTGLQIIKEGFAAQILELLYLPKLTSFRKEIAIMVMHLANASAHPEAEQIRPSILESEDDIFKFFSLISHTTPDVQLNILLTFCTMCDSPSGLRIRTALRQIPATKVLIRLCEDENQRIRSNAVRLFSSLTKDEEDKTFLEHVNKPCVETLLRILAISNETEEKTAVLGILSNLPRDNQLTEWMIEEGALEQIFSCLSNEDSNHGFIKRHLIESATAALCRFTVKTNQELQKRVVDAGFLPLLVGLLVSGTCITKRNACISLKQLSESSYSLSSNNPIKKRRIPSIFSCCSEPSEMGCLIHSGFCSVESTFCLVEADAIKVLVQLLGEQDWETCEASLEALTTLVDGELLQRGSKVLAGANGIEPIIKLLSCSSSPRLQEKALNVVERMFRLIDVQEGYGKSARLPLVDITQRGSSSMKSLAAKVLAHLNVIHLQSSYF